MDEKRISRLCSIFENLQCLGTVMVCDCILPLTGSPMDVVSNIMDCGVP